MLKRLGATGIVGFLTVLGGIALIAYDSPIVAAGIALVLAGLGLVIRSLVSSLMGAMGMGGMF
jgi:hypothetical protein